MKNKKYNEEMEELTAYIFDSLKHDLKYRIADAGVSEKTWDLLEKETGDWKWVKDFLEAVNTFWKEYLKPESEK